MKVSLSEVIDELNSRMENYLDEDEYEAQEVLQSFYDWIIEKYIE